jgi:hypothetical protein
MKTRHAHSTQRSSAFGQQSSGRSTRRIICRASNCPADARDRTGRYPPSHFRSRRTQRGSCAVSVRLRPRGPRSGPGSGRLTSHYLISRTWTR